MIHQVGMLTVGCLTVGSNTVDIRERISVSDHKRSDGLLTQQAFL